MSMRASEWTILVDTRRAHRRCRERRRDAGGGARLPQRGLTDILERREKLRIIDLEIEQRAEIGALHALGCQRIVVEQVAEKLGGLVEGAPRDPLADGDDIAIVEREQAAGILLHDLLQHVGDDLQMLVVAVRAIEPRQMHDHRTLSGARLRKLVDIGEQRVLGAEE
jgi:hypothetical protein